MCHAEEKNEGCRPVSGVGAGEELWQGTLGLESGGSSSHRLLSEQSASRSAGAISLTWGLSAPCAPTPGRLVSGSPAGETALQALCTWSLWSYHSWNTVQTTFSSQAGVVSEPR